MRLVRRRMRAFSLPCHDHPNARQIVKFPSSKSVRFQLIEYVCLIAVAGHLKHPSHGNSSSNGQRSRLLPPSAVPQLDLRFGVLPLGACFRAFKCSSPHYSESKPGRGSRTL